ncbi:MAG: hypothetical protein AB7O44_30305 [Hyphomicrobiaceae bacterium]
MSHGVTTRRAVDEDFAVIIEMLVEMHKEIGIFSLSVDKLAQRIRMVLDSGACLLALDDAGEVVGTIGLLVESAWYSEDPVLSDTWIFVRTGKRRLRVFDALIGGARTFSEQTAMPLVICLYALKDHDRKTRLFERYAKRIMTGYLFREAGGDFLAMEV